MAQYRKALSERLATHGFVEGRNLEIDARGATSQFHEDRQVAREYAASGCDAIFTLETRPTESALAATKTVPVVFAWVADPVASGLAKSYAEPGGNATGATNRFGELFVKRLELVRELLPKAKRVAVLRHQAASLYREVFSQPLRDAAAWLDFELFEVLTNQFAAEVERLARLGVEAILPNETFAGASLSGVQLVEASNRLRMPIVFANAGMVEAGGLMSLGTRLDDEVRRAADLLARVLKGADPGRLPVDQAASFELVLNLKTARAMGLDVPRSLLVRADRVID